MDGCRALQDVVTRHSRTNREELAVVLGSEYFHLCLFRNQFKIIGDHKPLESIFNNPNSKLPAKIERWRLKLQPYNFTVQYKPGKSNAADYMSRHPFKRATSEVSNIAEDYVNYITENAVPKALTFEKISDETHKDLAL